MSKRKDTEDIGPAKRRDSTSAKWVITSVCGDNSIDMCYADNDKMRDAMMLLYDTYLTRIKAEYVSLDMPPPAPFLGYQRMEALEGWCASDELQGLLPSPPQVMYPVWKALVQACKEKEIPLKYLAHMYAWGKSQKWLFGDVILERIDDEHTYALGTKTDAFAFDGDFHDTKKALICLQKATGLIFIDEDILQPYNLEYAQFKCASQDFIDYTRSFADHRNKNFWCFNRAAIAAAVTLWVETTL
jgi:hypothetical protein